MRQLTGSTVDHNWVNRQRMNDDVLDYSLNPQTGIYETAGQSASKKPGLFGGRIAGIKGKAGKLLGMAGTAANIAMPAMMFAPMFMGGGGGGSGEAPAGTGFSPNDMMELGYGRELQRQQILAQSLRGF